SKVRDQQDLLVRSTEEIKRGKDTKESLANLQSKYKALNAQYERERDERERLQLEVGRLRQALIETGRVSNISTRDLGRAGQTDSMMGEAQDHMMGLDERGSSRMVLAIQADHTPHRMDSVDLKDSHLPTSAVSVLYLHTPLLLVPRLQLRHLPAQPLLTDWDDLPSQQIDQKLRWA
ncbi:hypothetical protein HDU93_000709, partial [Gonapodya sp. JEL0774]